MIEKYSTNLQRELEKLGKVAIALSGGLDSSVLAAAAAKFLGVKNVLCLTANTPYMASDELSQAKRLCQKIGVKIAEIKYENIFEEIRLNPPDRCYLCKTKLFCALKEAAAKDNFSNLCDGTNVDDLNDYRPGMKALKELGISSPFLAANIGKMQIRQLAKNLSLDCAEKSAYACLMTRFEVGQKIDETLLRKLDKAEIILKENGFDGARIRLHCNAQLARIELKKSDLAAENFLKIKELSEEIKSLGFKFVSLDLFGYRRGNMNGI